MKEGYCKFCSNPECSGPYGGLESICPGFQPWEEEFETEEEVSPQERDVPRVPPWDEFS